MMVCGYVMLTGATFVGASSPLEPRSPSIADSSLTWAEVIQHDPDPKIISDAKLRDRIKETGLPWRVRDKLTDIEMLLVPPGKFEMGMSPGDDMAADDEKPTHDVTITEPFYIGRTEVTNKQWNAVMVSASEVQKIEALKRNKRIEKYQGEGLTKQEAQDKADEQPATQKKDVAAHPIAGVSWEDCKKFCEMSGMKLPTEAQWEYACRAGVRKKTYGAIASVAWIKDNSANGATHAVAIKVPNALGMYDMLGNVYEWCEDIYDGEYYKSCENGVVDPSGPVGGTELRNQVLRGGSWRHGPFNARASQRNGDEAPEQPNFYVGFRVTRSVVGASKGVNVPK